MGEFCDHGFADPRRCPRCVQVRAKMDALPRSLTLGRRVRSVYEDRPVAEVDEEWRAEQLRLIGLPTGWRPLDEFLRSRR